MSRHTFQPLSCISLCATRWVILACFSPACATAGKARAQHSVRSRRAKRAQTRHLPAAGLTGSRAKAGSAPGPFRKKDGEKGRNKPEGTMSDMASLTKYVSSPLKNYISGSMLQESHISGNAESVRHPSALRSF